MLLEEPLNGCLREGRSLIKYMNLEGEENRWREPPA